MKKESSFFESDKSEYNSDFFLSFCQSFQSESIEPAKIIEKFNLIQSK